jgi:hypothetical protein
MPTTTKHPRNRLMHPFAAQPPIKVGLLVAYIADGDGWSLTAAEMATLANKAGHKALPEVEIEIGRIIRRRAALFPAVQPAIHGP